MELKVIWSPEDIKPGLRVYVGRRASQRVYMVYVRRLDPGENLFGLVNLSDGLTYYEGDAARVAAALSLLGTALPADTPLEDLLP